jgi:sugar diacid utilization regulator
MTTKTATLRNNNFAGFMGKFAASEYTKSASTTKAAGKEPTQQTSANSVDFTDHIFTEIIDNFNPNNLYAYKSAISVMGYNAEAKRMAILVHLDGFRDNILESLSMSGIYREDLIKKWKRKVEESMNSFFSKSSDIIVTYVGDEKFLVLKAIEDAEEEKVKGMISKSFKSIFMPLHSAQISEISVGFGNAYLDVEGWCESCKEANTALKLGHKLYGDGKSYYFNDFGILYAIADGDSEKKAKLATKMLERLRDRDLISTLTCFLDEDLNTTNTALKLHVHRNTVLYRLDQIAYRLKLDPRKFEEAFKIKMALYVREICC